MKRFIIAALFLASFAGAENINPNVKSFSVMGAPDGTNPTALGPNKTLTFSSDDDSCTITGDSGSNNLDWSCSGGSGGSGITQINGSSVAHQVIAAGTGITVNSAAGTTTIASSKTYGNLTSPTSGVSVGSGTGAVVGSGTTISIQTASGSQPGLLSAADWTTFNGKQNTLTLGDLISGSTGVSVTGGTGAVVGSGASISVQTASGSQPGLLSAADWNTFNGKQNALSVGDLSSSTSGVTIGGGTGAVIGAGSTIDIQTATGSLPGLLSAADWTAFNGKQASGNYITALTGDVSASGPGSAAASISAATVTGKLLTGYVSGAGTVASTDSILQGIQKLNGNTALKLDASSPSWSGTMTTPLTASNFVVTNGSSQLAVGGATTSLVTLTGSQTLTNKTLTSPIIGTISNTGTLTLPTSTDTLVGKATTDTLTNKTISSGTWSGTTATGQTSSSVLATDGSGNLTTFGLSSTVATLTGSQTLTNKTLTTPIISSISNSGTITIPTGTLTLSTLTGSETLTNKTLTSPVLNTATVGTSMLFGNYHMEPAEFGSGNTSTAKTIDWSQGSAQSSTLTGNVTYTFSNPVTGGSYVLRVLTGAGSFTATWPAAVKWPAGTAPTITVTASRMDLINFYYDGTDYYGSFTQNYTP